MQRHCFEAMGTTVDCLLEAETSTESSGALWAVEAEFRRLERLLSRFLPDSELSALNRDGSLHCGTRPRPRDAARARGSSGDRRTLRPDHP